MSGARYYLGRVPLDSVTLTGALDRIVSLARAGAGGTVYTPNVDHVVVAQHDDAFEAAYSEVSLSLVDGTPVYWASRLLRFGLPEKVSGSDLFEPLIERAAQLGLPVFFLGGAPGVAELACNNLMARYPGLTVAGVGAPRVDERGHAQDEEALVRQIRDRAPALVFVACGAPKSELFSHRVRALLRPAVLVCVGAAIDFAAGTAKRAPRWMSRVGLEWAYRLSREPRRLAQRYLLRDPAFFWILARQLLVTGGRALRLRWSLPGGRSRAELPAAELVTDALLPAEALPAEALPAEALPSSGVRPMVEGLPPASTVRLGQASAGTELASSAEAEVAEGPAAIPAPRVRDSAIAGTAPRQGPRDRS